MSSAEAVEAPFTASFRSALVGAESSWTIDGTKLRKNGNIVADLASVQSGHWHESAHRGVQLRTLKLKTDRGSVSIAVNSSAGQQSFRSFYELALTVLARVAVHSPNARINMGGGLFNMIMMFVLGLVFFALGLFCFVMAVGEAPFYIGLLGVPFAAIGGLLAIAMRPWNHHRLSVPAIAALATIVGT